MTRLARGACRQTRKKRFPDALAAKMALATIRRSDAHEREKTPVRSYECEFCKGYHLTSQAKREQHEVLAS